MTWVINIHNSWVNESTKQIPFKLLIGGLLSGHHQTTIDEPTNETRETHLHDIQEKVSKALEHTQSLLNQQNKSNYQPYQEGEQVWLEATNLKTTHPTSKLALRRYGPFPIIQKISDIVYQLKLPHQWCIHNVFHASLLSPYTKTKTHGPNYTQPPPNIIEGEPEYEVEAIIGSQRTRKQRRLQYKIWWKGYLAAHNSWELVAQVHALELIKKYQMKTLKQKVWSTIHIAQTNNLKPTLGMNNLLTERCLTPIRINAHNAKPEADPPNGR